MDAYREYVPDPPWRRWIECFWSVSSAAPSSGYPVRPDGCLDIIYSQHTGLRAIGTMTVEQRYDLAARTQTIGVRFRPGMAGRFLRVPPSELTDLTIPLADLWGPKARELTERLEDSRSPESCFASIVEHLPPPGAPNDVQRAIGRMVASYGMIDLDGLAREANLSTRQLRRRFLMESGLTPKHLSRVLRFRRACELARQAPFRGWPAVAADAGYFDQAHLIHDFREFTGQTPMSVFSNTRAALLL
ncbi:MAG: hypothetical protein C5B51_02740 [Terriglobia bacterium]|nr:MAG: hypothetical protein C5B51_02740 [Terriglobia bacterium]